MFLHTTQRFRNLPEASGMFLHTTQTKKVPEGSGTFRNLPETSGMFSCTILDSRFLLISRLIIKYNSRLWCKILSLLVGCQSQLWFDSNLSNPSEVVLSPLPPSKKSLSSSPPSRCVNEVPPVHCSYIGIHPPPHALLQTRDGGATNRLKRNLDVVQPEIPRATPRPGDEVGQPAHVGIPGQQHPQRLTTGP